MGYLEFVMTTDQSAEWRKAIVGEMLSKGICIEQIIPDVMIAEEFITTGKYPEKWEKEDAAKTQSGDS
jgi:hypothetical protein